MDTEEMASKKLEIITNVSDLGGAIKRLAKNKLLLEEDLKDDFHVIFESLKPANILKHTIHEVQESTELKHNLFKVALGLGAGYFSKKLVVGKSAGILKKALGTALQYGITNFVAKKNDREEVNGYHPKKKNLFKRILSI
jgi:hypothetical protein